MREPLDVAALTRRMVEGDDMAYRLFHHAYFDRLWRYLIVATAGHEDTAREALQRTLARVVRHIRVFSTDEIFWSWLTVLARTSLFDERRTRRRYLAFLDRFTPHAEVQYDAARISAAHNNHRLVELLERQLALLPTDERELVEKKYFERQPVAVIAAELGTTEKAIESRLVRLRRKLKHAVLTELHDEQRA